MKRFLALLGIGRANVRITLNIYNHVAPVMVDDAPERVAALRRGSPVSGST